MFDIKSLLPVKYSVGNRYFWVFSFLCLLSFVLVKETIGTSFNRYPEVIYSLFFLTALFTKKWILIQDKGAQLFLGSILIVFLLLGVNYLQVGQEAIELFSATQLIKLTFFVMIGFCLGGNLKNIYIFMFFSALGMLIALFKVDVIKEFQEILNGRRVDFDIHNAQHISMYFGLILIGSLSVIPRIIKMDVKNWSTWFVYISLFVFIVISSLILVGAQTRAAWIGLCVVLMVFIISLLIKIEFKKLLLAAGVLLIFAGVAWTFSQTIKKRVYKEAKVVELFLEEGIDSVPYTSVGIRLHTWDVAFDKIAQKPLVGYGAKVRNSVIQESEKLPDRIKKRFGHFHNSYIEFTLAYGLFGLGFLLSIFIWVNLRIYKLSRVNKECLPIWYFTFYGSVFMAIINIFESYVFFLSGVYAMSVLLAPAYTLHLADLYQNKVTKQVD